MNTIKYIHTKTGQLMTIRTRNWPGATGNTKRVTGYNAKTGRMEVERVFIRHRDPPLPTVAMADRAMHKNGFVRVRDLNNRQRRILREVSRV